MSESSPRLELNEDILLEGDNSIPPSNIHKAADKSSDLVDTVELFKTILDSKLEQDCLKRKIKEDVTLKIKREGNRIQYTLNEELLDTVNKLSKFIPNSNTQAYILVLDITDKIKSRNKKIRIADSSPAGWGTVREYEANAVASDSEDERKMRQAETRYLPRRSLISASNLTLKIRLVNNLRNRMVTLLMLSIINVISNSPFVGASQGVSLAQSTCATTASSKATGEKKLSSSRQPQVIQPQLNNLPEVVKHSLNFTLQSL
ncbi:Hypothetical predicted protein [Mytilus galloprovincialis]|uniref:Uncharacterized protein n=1 Tax=Mytilus galloprovincialis TaxID=29158 RepID=A0A8B6DN93_MYTGA|nr:Hypothetical predicted protein [Mytilus galloprovincialis]